jgi:hypothetical protein
MERTATLVTALSAINDYSVGHIPIYAIFKEA